MLTSPFFRRLFLGYLLLACAAIAVVGIVGAQRLRSSYIQRSQQALRDETRLVGQMLGTDLRARDISNLCRQVQQIGAALDRRVTVVAADGTVLADNEADPDRMENHATRPELVAARRDGEGNSIRPSGTLGQDLMYYAQRVAGADGQDEFVRLAVHMRALDEHLGAFYTGIALAAGLAVLGTALLSYLFARRHTVPLVELTQMADALRQGQLNRRVLPENVGEMGTLATALNAMAQSLSSQMAQTAQGRTQLMAVLSSMSEGVIATDTHQNVLLSNAAAARLLGFPAGDMAGRFLWELVRHEPILQAVNDVLARRIPTHGQVGPIEGRHLDVTCCTFPADRPPQGLVIVAHDATQSVRYQELRKEFVANVSHELRTPLTAIKGFAETLRDGALDDPARARQYLSTIEKHANQLTNLVNDLLELSRLENYPGVPQCMPLDVGALIRRAVEMLRPAATRKQQTLHVDLQPGLPSMTANPDYLERAVANLLDNAVKYTPEDGTITVSARTCERPDAKGIEQVVISVADTGIGIPAADLPRIFERFYRVDRSRSRDMGGTGLGLSIVKHIAQSHGGRIEVSSTPGKGSTFRMILPAHPPED